MLLLAMICADAARAGAWPREQGTWFLSGSVTLGWPQDMTTATSPEPTQQYNALYIEYGLSDRLTLGLDLGRSVSGGGKTIAFLQYPLRNQDTGLKAAVQIGLGTIDEAPVIRPGFSLGWGYERGWFSADGVAEFGIQTQETDWKLDVTLGRRLNRDRKLILQMQMGAPSSDPPFARFAPSIVFPLNERLKLETGGVWGVTGDTQMGLKIGLWAEF
ncbi:hypothetical protein J1C49_09420 [Cognatishimia sp. F0-27]|nr:hypothetical protein [Cognatishimia sp. F0-27]MCC1492827.1 hypothetical protein [Cognatishimia sp. F0-27]